MARNHRQLRALVPYLQAQGLRLSYDRQDNVLEADIIMQLELLARVVYYMSSGRFDAANALMPELLAHPAWGLDSKTLWQLSIAAHSGRVSWIDAMQGENERLGDIAQWLIETVQLALFQPLEYLLDRLFGTVDLQSADDTHTEQDALQETGLHEEYVSPFRAYFFPADALETNPSAYIAHLAALTAIRQKLREYRPDTVLKLADFVDFVDMHHELGIGIRSNGRVGESEGAIELLTAHKAKGLEFDNVSIVGLSDSNWGEGARGRSKLIRFPHNLPISMVGETTDERIRLLFVALTRARNELHLSTYRRTVSGKETLPVAYLSNNTELFIVSDTASPNIATASLAWQAPLMTIAKHTMEELLSPMLERYKLSATHLGNFLDVARGGPELFLLQNLLRFPQAMSPSAAYGSAVHAALRRAHEHLSATSQRRPVEDVLHDFETELARHQLSEDETEYLTKRGGDTLTAFLAQRYESFTPSQHVERSFGTEAIVIEGARLTGAIDLIDIDETNKTIIVTDYKTGRPVPTWKGRTDYERIKLHHYRQQLIFYKLLIENSRQYEGYTVASGVIEFVEPTTAGKIERLELSYDNSEVAELTKLIKAVWGRILAMDFALNASYDPSYKGILSFEQDLLA